jgi:hypothetical protein
MWGKRRWARYRDAGTSVPSVRKSTFNVGMAA